MISVIVPAKDASQTLPACLKALLNQESFKFGKDYEIIVVDDGSKDDTSQVAQTLGVAVIRQANAGRSAARNAGVQASRGDILAFTDADCQPASDWLMKLTQPFLNPQIEGVKGAYRSNQSEAVARFVQLEYESKYQRMERQERIDFIDTYSAAYRRQVFIQNGGFDPTILVCEDQELSFRLARKGYWLVFQPGAVVYHLHSRNIQEYVRRKYWIGYWKAFLLNWLPEKLFEDSHTLPSQRWQILCLGLALVSLGLSPFVQPLLFCAIIALAVFYLTAAPFLNQILRRNATLAGWSLLLLAIRAGALGAGLLAGFLLPVPGRIRPRQGLNLVERVVKRFADVALSLIALVVCLPVMGILALAIKFETKGPAIFTQIRAGENGRPFKVYKLRTMVYGAEKKLAEIIDTNQLPEPVYKIPNDPRVTHIGKFLRRSSLDELPQLWNILKGDMSLVGPRPEELWLVERYNDHQRQRLAVKPGLTGPMQVSGRGELDLSTRLELELEYIQNYSLWKDFILLLKSIPAVLSGKGAS